MSDNAQNKGKPLFAQLPLEILEDKRLSPVTKVVYAALDSYDIPDRETHKRKFEVWPGLAKLAERSGCSKNSVTNATEVLNQHGYIEKIRVGKKCTNRYRLAWAKSRKSDS